MHVDLEPSIPTIVSLLMNTPLRMDTYCHKLGHPE